ncbi:class I SAM-dependent methyltransferase [Paenibacillus sp. 1-18]|uniref:class I SAM-dependent methyltransferase n=1 Tax=Paenibacillus sp. 1-18 TaxID=1333846 RepID=UPI0004B68ED2|nr:class I SAM-dependent methyltransferase [Paenibacillus sp. 1-18]
MENSIENLNSDLAYERDLIASERDQLKEYLHNLSQDNNQLEAQRNVLIEERDQLKHYLHNSSQENDQLIEQRSVLTKERDELKDHLMRISKENSNREIQIQELLLEVQQYKSWVPPGHYYSPIPALDEVKSQEDKIFKCKPTEIPGIDLNTEEQFMLFDAFKEYYRDLPFSDEKQDNFRYYLNNPFFSYSDGIFLYCILRHFKPKKIIEIGSGFSSAATLDVNERYFNNELVCTFIEPYPERLQSLLKANDRVRIIEKKLQEVDLSEFATLSAGDILFIDSTHVSKTGSDVNYIFFEILPLLKKGVFIHFHDILYPFEYLKEWVYEGRAWNEVYMLRSFLQYNNAYKIKFWSSYLINFYKEDYNKFMPQCFKNTGGSIWLQKME